MEIDKVKFKDSDIFEKYKEEIGKNKERYKPVLLKALEEDIITCKILEEIIELWEKEWKEEANIYVDKLKFHYFIFREYKEEIGKNKERYKPVLIDIFEKNEISYRIYEDIIEIWENEWKEVPNIYIDRIKIDVDRKKFGDDKKFKEYKKEIIKNKERYKPVLLDILERDRYIEDDISKEIIDIWENEWKEEPNIYLDRYIGKKFYLYKEKIKKDKERYKHILLENDKIDYYRYEEIIDIWENGWKEEPIIKFKKETLNLDKLKFEYKELLEKYKKEIGKNKERYKPVLLELLEEDKIDEGIYKEIIDIWEKEWKEEPIIKLKRETLNLDKLKFYYDYDDNIFEKYKEEIKRDKERYKPVLLELLKENKIDSDIEKDIVDIWEKDWIEVPNIYIDKLKFEWDIFKEYKEEIKREKERYKPIVLELKKENRWIDEDTMNIWKKDWKEEGEIEGNPELIDIDSKDYFVENRDEIINNREKYEVTVRRFLFPVTYREIKPILNSWGESDIELLIKLMLKSTYRTYNTLYSVLNDELIENKESIIEYISKNYKAELKDKVVKLFILSTIQTIDELESKLKLLKTKDMDKLVEYLIKLELDKDIDSIVLENVVKIVIDKISEMKYIKLLIEIKKSKDNISTKYIDIFKNIFEKIETKDSFDSLVKEFEFDSPIEFLKYLKEKNIPAEATMRYCKLLKEYYPIEIEKIALEIGEELLEKFDGVAYKKCIEYSKNIDILDNFLNYEDLMKFKVVIGVNKYFDKDKISSIDIKYSDKDRIKIAYWGKYKNVKRVYNLDEYIYYILPIEDKYINYEIDDLGFNDKKERYFKYNDDNIVVKLKDRKLKIFNSSGTEIKKLSSTSEDFYTVRAKENIKELKAMIKNVYTDGDKGIKKEYCNDVLRDYDLWREIYIDNILLQEYTTNLIWEEVDSDNNIVGRFRYTQDGEFCDSNDDEYIINKENRIRLLSLDKVSNDEVDRWREQLDDYEIVQPVPQLELYDIDYSDIDPDNLDISNNEIELGKLEKNDIGLELKFKDEEMYFEIENILKIELEDKINWVKYKKLSKDTKLKVFRIKLLTNSDYSLRVVKLVKNKLGI